MNILEDIHHLSVVAFFTYFCSLLSCTFW